MDKTHLVIAGNKREFIHFCDERLRDVDNGCEEFCGDTFIYYSCLTGIRGYKFYNAYNYGTHFWRKDIDSGYIKSIISNKWYLSELMWEDGRYLKIEHV